MNKKRTIACWSHLLMTYSSEKIPWNFHTSLRSHLKNSCFGFYQGFQTPRNNKSTRPRAFICFLVLGAPNETLALVSELWHLARVYQLFIPTFWPSWWPAVLCHVENCFIEQFKTIPRCAQPTVTALWNKHFSWFFIAGIMKAVKQLLRSINRNNTQTAVTNMTK